MEDVLSPDRPDTDYLVEHLRRGRLRVECEAVSGLYQSLGPNSFAQGPQDEWDKKMKETYEAGAELKTRAQKALENYRTGNTSPLP